MSQKANLIAAGKEQFSQYHVAEYLTNSTDVAAYLKAAKEEQQKKPPQREKAQELEV